MISFNNNNIKELHYSGHTIQKVYSCGGELVFDFNPTTDYSKKYLTVIPEESTNVYIKNNSVIFNGSTDSGASWSILTAGDPIHVSEGNELWIKGSGPVADQTNGIGTINVTTGRYRVEGNILSLLYDDNFMNNQYLLNNYEFARLFYQETGLTDASNLYMTKDTSVECFKDMFYYCTNLTAAPELPATDLYDGCYYGMFRYCRSLTTPPSSIGDSATTVPSSGCTYMFYGCSGLTVAPELPAISLYMNCYYGMFDGCTSLTTAPELPATSLAMLCYASMFQGCTSLTTAPILPAHTLDFSSYSNMFNGCTSLNYITCLADDITAINCTQDWVKNTASSGTFYKNPNMSSWGSGDSGIPNGWTVNDYL